MQITKSFLDNLYTLSAEVDQLNEEVSDAIKAAKLNGKNKITVTRKDGSQHEVSEKLLWDEVWQLGPTSEAAQALATRYPEIFTKNADSQEKAAEMNRLVAIELGINGQGVTVSDIIRIVDAMIDYKLNYGKQGGEDNRTGNAGKEGTSQA